MKRQWEWGLRKKGCGVMPRGSLSQKGKTLNKASKKGAGDVEEGEKLLLPAMVE